MGKHKLCLHEEKGLASPPALSSSSSFTPRHTQKVAHTKSSSTLLLFCITMLKTTYIQAENVDAYKLQIFQRYLENAGGEEPPTKAELFLPSLLRLHKYPDSHTLKGTRQPK